jgi:hypothetical protein
VSPRSVIAALLLAGIVACGEEGAPGEIAVYVAATGGTAGTGGSPGAVAPLSARIEVTGNHAPCGSCDSLVAIVTGGTPPYTYEWSDPTLAGPGPHGVCPRENVRYAVVVKDSSGALATGQQQNALGSAYLECTPSQSDAGSGGGLNGCIVVPRADPVTCPTDAPDAVSSTLIEFDVEPGRTYQYTYTQLLPIGLGVASTVDVYLGMNPCERAQKAFTLQLDSTVTQSHCFTPNAMYRYSTTVIHVNGIPLTFGVTATFCDSCTSASSP